MKDNPVPLKGINIRKEPLTPEILRQLSGNLSLSDEEADGLILTINKLANIFLELSRLKNTYCIDSQQDVYLSKDSDSPEIAEFIPLIKKNAA